jgi:beta-xylosidase
MRSNNLIAAAAAGVSVATLVCITTQASGAQPERENMARAAARSNNVNAAACANPRTTVADPGVIRRGKDSYVVLGTSGYSPLSGAVTVHVSRDGGCTWRTGNRAFRRLPRWATPASPVWGPDIYRIKYRNSTREVIYYAAKDRENGEFSIGAAIRTQHGWRHTRKPVVPNPGYSLIDPAFFRDPRTGQKYLLWKDNINAEGQQARIVLSQVSAGGLKRTSGSTHLLRARGGNSWEGLVVEAPTLVARPDGYYLFYSGGAFTNDTYGVGVARLKCRSGGLSTCLRHGKFERMPHLDRRYDGRILRSDRTYVGPGGQDIQRSADGKWLFFYHTYQGDDRRTRYLMLDTITWLPGGWPKVSDGTPR